MLDHSCAYQLVEWLRGNPVHNVIRKECCPDFSCCSPELLWPIERRREFVEASDEHRDEMLFGALGMLVRSEAVNDG